MIATECLPGLRWPTSPWHHVYRDSRLGDMDAELEQLAMDAGCTPEWVLKAHSSNKVAHLLGNPWSASETTGLPPPVSREALSMPTHDRFGLDDRYGSKDVRKPPIEPNEQSAIGPAQIQSTWRTVLQDIELMPQYQNFDLKPPARLETVTEHAPERKAIRSIQQSCSDSSVCASPLD